MARSILEEFDARVYRAKGLIAERHFAEADQCLRDAVGSMPKAVWDTVPLHERARFDSYRGHCLYALGQYCAALALIEPAYRARQQARVLDQTLTQQLGDLVLCYRAVGDLRRALKLIEEGRSLAASIRDPSFDSAAFLKTLDQSNELVRHTADNQALYRMSFTGMNVRGTGQFPGALQASIPLGNLDITCHVERLIVQPRNLSQLFVHLVFTLDNPLPVDTWPSEGIYPLEQVPLVLALLLPCNARAFSPEADSFAITPTQAARPVLEGQHYLFFHPLSYHRGAPHPVPLDRAYRHAEAYAANLRSRLPARARVEFKTTITYYPEQGQRPSLDQRFLLLLPYGRTIYDPLPDTSGVETEGIELARLGLQVARFREDRTSFSPERLMSFSAPPALPKAGRAAPAIGSEHSTKIELTSLEMLRVELSLATRAQLTMATATLMPVVPSGTYDLVRSTEMAQIGASFLNMSAQSNRVPILKFIVGNHGEEEKAIELSAPETPVFRSLQLLELLPGQSVRTIEFHPQLRNDCALFAPTLALEDRDVGVHRLEVEAVMRDLTSSAKVITRSLVKVLPPDYMVWWVSNDEGASFLDLRQLIARWVTPYSRSIDAGFTAGQLVRANLGTAQSVAAAYEWLRSRKFTYDNTRLNFGYEEENAYQRVRFPETSLRHRHVNCIDGTILLAALVERLGHSCAVVFVPNHAFLAYSEAHADGMSVTGVETTGLCDSWTRHENELTFSEAGRGCSLSFEEARRVGNIQLAQYAEELFPQKEQPKDPGTRDGALTAQSVNDPEMDVRPGRLKQCAVVWLSAARRAGVLPFSFFGGMRDGAPGGPP